MKSKNVLIIGLVFCWGACLNSPVAACWQTYGSSQTATSASVASNVAQYEYSHLEGAWVAASDWHDSSAQNYLPSWNDSVYVLHDLGYVLVITADLSGLAASSNRRFSASARFPQDHSLLCLDEEEPNDQGIIDVIGSRITMAPHFFGPFFAILIPVAYYAGQLPPAPPQTCSTNIEGIDGNEDSFESLWEDSSPDSDLPLEQGGLLWPNGDGTYDFLRYGIEIPGGGAGPCGITSPPYASFPSPSEWPDGVINVHTQPYHQFEVPEACGSMYTHGPSGSDRAHIRWLRTSFGKSDVMGIVLDKDMIQKYGGNATEDTAPRQRCGY